MTHVVFATAEPYGAYHLAALDESAFVESGVTAQHWLPGAGPPQRPGWMPTLRAPDLPENTGLVVVTGGARSAWTTAVARTAAAAGVPVAYLEVGWPSDNGPFPVPIAAAGCAAPVSAGTVESLTGCEPTVVGRPLPPPVTPGPEVLLLPIVSAEVPDGQRQLHRAAAALAAAGYVLRVAAHPREPDGLWDDVARDVTAEPKEHHFAGVRLVVGTPTTRMVDAVGLGLPVLRMLSGRRDIDEHPMLSRLGAVTSPETVVADAARAEPTDPRHTADVVGPRLDTAELLQWLLPRALPRRARARG